MTLATVIVVPNSTATRVVVVVLVVTSVTRVIGVAVCGCVVVESAKKVCVRPGLLTCCMMWLNEQDTLY